MPEATGGSAFPGNTKGFRKAHEDRAPLLSQSLGIAAVQLFARRIPPTQDGVFDGFYDQNVI